MDTAQWPQEILVKPSMEELIPNSTTCSNIISSNHNNNTNNNSTNIISNTNNIINNNNDINSKSSSSSLERKVRPQKDHAVNCPRCNSTNTKFCYYNNYSLTQPRYFCKTCRRYWTEGGSLRNIPVGGGSRKNKRSSSSSSSSTSTSSASKKLASHDLIHHHHHQNPNKIFHQGQDLNLGFPPNHHHHHQQQEFRSLSEFMQLPTIETTPISKTPNNNNNTTTNNNGGESNNHHHHHLSALELLSGLTSSRGLTPFMPMPVSDPNGVYSSGFTMHDFKPPSLNFSLVDGLGNGLGNGYGALQGEMHQQHQQHQQQATGETTTDTNHNNSSNNNNGRLLFPFEDLKQVSSTTSADHTTTNTSADNHDQNGEQGDSAPGYWTGMLGNAGSW